MSRSHRSSSRSGSAVERDWRRYEDDYRDNYGRDRDKDYGRDEDKDREKREELKPYKAVGAALDSAERQRRRMTYGRVTPKP